MTENQRHRDFDLLWTIPTVPEQKECRKPTTMTLIHLISTERETSIFIQGTDAERNCENTQAYADGNPDWEGQLKPLLTLVQGRGINGDIKVRHRRASTSGRDHEGRHQLPLTPY
jgi:hypothetical protein